MEQGAKCVLEVKAHLNQIQSPAGSGVWQLHKSVVLRHPAPTHAEPSLNSSAAASQAPYGHVCRA